MARPSRALLLLLSLTLLALLAPAFYLPGIAPTDYEEGMQLDVFADKLTSPKNKVPYDYYSLSLCKPSEDVTRSGKVKSKHVNLGQALMGDRREPTPFELFMRAPESCKLLCHESLDFKAKRAFKNRIVDDYYVRLSLDNMPSVLKTTGREGQEYIINGFPLGFHDENNKAPLLYNHLEMKVLFHEPKFSPFAPFQGGSDAKVYRVVGFEVSPVSIAHDPPTGDGKAVSTCPAPGAVEAPKGPLIISDDSNALDVYFTYSVTYEESDIKWATRWDPLLKASPEFRRIQWFSIINSCLIALFLTALVAMILMRTVYLDFARYNNPEDREELMEDSGWKLIHGDVFRSPPFPAVLAVLVGSGAQIFVMTMLTLCFAIMGFVSPANRGGLLIAMLSLWVLSAFVCGFTAARLYSNIGGLSKKSVTIGASLFYSTIVFVVFFLLNLLLAISKSSSSVSFFTLLILVVLWFGISIPLNIVGAFLAYKLQPVDFPCKTSNIPREIQKYSPVSPRLFAFLSGILPFGVIFIELVFILNSLWQNEFFYMFGFLFLVAIILLITCAEVSIVLTYLTLTKEDYNWWWRSFFGSATSGLYVFIYSIIYLCTQPELKGMHFVSSLLFVGYTFIISLGFLMMTGFIGFFTSFWFVRKIYGSVHID